MQSYHVFSNRKYNADSSPSTNSQSHLKWIGGLAKYNETPTRCHKIGVQLEVCKVFLWEAFMHYILNTYTEFNHLLFEKSSRSVIMCVIWPEHKPMLNLHDAIN